MCIIVSYSAYMAESKEKVQVQTFISSVTFPFTNALSACEPCCNFIILTPKELTILRQDSNGAFYLALMNLKDMYTEFAKRIRNEDSKVMVKKVVNFFLKTDSQSTIYGLELVNGTMAEHKICLSSRLADGSGSILYLKIHFKEAQSAEIAKYLQMYASRAHEEADTAAKEKNSSREKIEEAERACVEYKKQINRMAEEHTSIEADLLTKCLFILNAKKADIRNNLGISNPVVEKLIENDAMEVEEEEVENKEPLEIKREPAPALIIEGSLPEDIRQIPIRRRNRFQKVERRTSQRVLLKKTRTNSPRNAEDENDFDALN